MQSHLGGFPLDQEVADYFFDGLILDWIVQSKISSALDRAEAAHRKVSSLVARLRDDQTDCKAKAADLEIRRVRLIEQA